MMTTILSGRGCAASLFVAALTLSSAFAQDGVRLSPDVRMRQAGSTPNSGYTEASVGIEGNSGNGTPNNAGPHTVSADLLRHPISEKARRMLQKAWDAMKSGDHEGAIQQLLETLAKYPDSAAHVHSLLGVEYLRTDRFTDAVSSLEQAALLLPHDALTHHNFGLSLICAGNYQRGEQEVRRAVELEPSNPTMQALFNFLREQKRPRD